MSPEAVAVLGVGMHEWGKWGRPFHEYGIEAALAALDDAGIGWDDVQFVAGGETVRNGYPGYVAAATITQALGWVVPAERLAWARPLSSWATCSRSSGPWTDRSVRWGSTGGLDQRHDRGLVTRSDDQVAFPVTGHGPIFDLSRAFADHAHVVGEPW